MITEIGESIEMTIRVKIDRRKNFPIHRINIKQIYYDSNFLFMY